MSNEPMPIALPGSTPEACGTSPLVITDDERRGLPSASGLERLCLCPGSWQAEQSMLAADSPPEPESADAAAGTRLHKHLEEGTLPADDAEAEAVEWCRRMERELAQELLHHDKSCLREVRFFDEDGKFSGKPDAVYRNASRALVVDYKFGRGEVAEAAGNLQLAALAVLVWQSDLEDIGEVYACILQPFVSRQRPQVVCYSVAQLFAAEEYIRGAIRKAQEPQAALRPGVRQCKYCRAQAVCPAAMREALSCRAVERWECLPPEARAGLWKRSQQARRLADAIERRVKGDLKNGVELPGLELAPGRTSYTITDAQAAFTLLHSELGITAEEFTTCCKVGITPLDKLVHSKRKAQDSAAKVKDSAAWLREALSDCAEMKTTDGSIRERKGENHGTEYQVASSGAGAIA